MKLSIIAAMSRGGVIGDKGRVPWVRIPKDMANFRRLTMGKPCIMGRKTHESIGRPLDGRKNIVLSKTMIRGMEGLCVVRTPAEAIVEAFGCRNFDEAFIVGGAEIYRTFWPLCEEAYVTTVALRGDDGDTYFPFMFDTNEWEEVLDERWNPKVRYQGFRRVS